VVAASYRSAVVSRRWSAWVIRSIRHARRGLVLVRICVRFPGCRRCCLIVLCLPGAAVFGSVPNSKRQDRTAIHCALPSLDDEKTTIFSVLDLCAGYYGIGIGLDEASQPCTAFSTKNRHFQFTRVNMGYVNSRAFFTQSLYKIFAAEVRRHMIIYVDDVLKKMTIAMCSANFLDFTLKAGGYTVDNSGCKTVQEYQRLRNAKEVKRFLGISNYFRQLIRNCSKRSAPLRELMAKDVIFEWTDRQEASFCNIRDAICSPPVLGYPD